MIEASAMVAALPRGPALRKHRIAHGLCPTCGKEAAPYYLCGDCRFGQKLGRILHRLTAAGGLEKTKVGGKVAWRMLDDAKCAAVDFKDAAEGDKRLQPKLGGKRVDVLETLVRVMHDIGRPASIEEILAAWGRLRDKRRTASLAGDVSAIIEARRRQDRKAAKRAAVATRHTGAAA